jgi:predicted SPOUT superfamily RNA methylase MTH1
VSSNHRSTEELSDEKDLRKTLLMLQLDQLHWGVARCGEIESAMTDVGQFTTAALIGVGQIEVVTAHGEVSLRNGDRVTVRIVRRSTIGAARNLVVRLDAPALVVMRARH